MQDTAVFTMLVNSYIYILFRIKLSCMAIQPCISEGSARRIRESSIDEEGERERERECEMERRRERNIEISTDSS